MSGKLLLGLAAAAGLILAPQAHATTFSFTYASPDGLLGSVNISGTQSSSGTFDITSGTDTVTGGNGLVGAFALFQNASYPTTIVSPSGYFTYDDLFTPNLNPFVDNSGLLFTSGSSEVNVFSNGPGSYTHYDNTGFNASITISAINIGQDKVNIPEAGTLTLLSTILLCLGFMRWFMPWRPARGSVVHELTD